MTHASPASFLARACRHAAGAVAATARHHVPAGEGPGLPRRCGGSGGLDLPVHCRVWRGDQSPLCQRSLICGCSGSSSTDHDLTRKVKHCQGAGMGGIATRTPTFFHPRGAAMSKTTPPGMKTRRHPLTPSLSPSEGERVPDLSAVAPRAKEEGRVRGIFTVEGWGEGRCVAHPANSSVASPGCVTSLRTARGATRASRSPPTP